jgi:hypothetical protein
MAATQIQWAGILHHSIGEELTMRLGFTIRDLLWLTLVVALCLGWWLHSRRLSDQSQRVEGLRYFKQLPLQK